MPCKQCNFKFVNYFDSISNSAFLILIIIILLTSPSSLTIISARSFGGLLLRVTLKSYHHLRQRLRRLKDRAMFDEMLKIFEAQRQNHDPAEQMHLHEDVFFFRVIPDYGTHEGRVRVVGLGGSRSGESDDINNCDGVRTWVSI
jgi:hypothetical protein